MENRKTIFIGGIYPECKVNEIISEYGCLPQVAADSLQKSILCGLEENIESHITFFNVYFLPLSFTGFDRVEAYSWQGKYGENYNLPFLKNRLLSFESKKKSVVKNVSKWLDENTEKGETVNVIVYPGYFPFMKAVTELKKTYKLNVCMVVPDLPQFMGLKKHRSLYNKVSASVSLGEFNKNLVSIDSFIFLTDNMNEKVNIHKKPYDVIEGIIPTNYEFTGKTEKSEIKNIVYSGTLQLKYGIETMLEAAKYIKDENVRFLYYGTGEGVEAIKEYSEKDKRIVYMGNVSRDELHKIHQNAEMLVNPRPGYEDFVKYSFPSKNLEYLMSARPVVAYMLDGIPREYGEYFFVPEGYEAKDLAECINKVLSLSEEEKSDFGKKARNFVSENKSPKAQAKKIIDLIS